MVDQSLYEQQANRISARDGLIGEMAEIARQVVEQFGKELPDLWQQITMLAVTKEFPEHAKKVGPAAIKELKKAVGVLSEQAQQVAESALKGPGVWSHLSNENARGAYYVRRFGDRSEVEERLRGPISQAVGAVMQLLRDRGFASRAGNRYGSYQPSDKIRDLAVKYEAKHDQLVEIDSNISDGVRRISEAEAEDLWKDT